MAAGQPGGAPRERRFRAELEQRKAWARANVQEGQEKVMAKAQSLWGAKVKKTIWRKFFIGCLISIFPLFLLALCILIVILFIFGFF